MKRIAAIALMVVCGLTTLLAQTYPYLETTRRTIPTPPDVTGFPCTGAMNRSLVFDFEPMQEGSRVLDLTVGKTVWEVYPPPPKPGDPITHRLTYSFNVGGEFPTYSAFQIGTSLCNIPHPLYLKKFVFGNLRPSVTPARRDLAVISTGYPFRTLINWNTLNPIIPMFTAHSLDGEAVDGSWGAFTDNDVLEDLALTDPNNSSGPQIRIHPNTPSGYLEENPIVFYNYSAQKIVLAQIDKPIGYLSDDKLDLVGYDGTQIKIWRNDNSNGLNLLQVPIDLGFPLTITSMAVADINNDGYNDIVVGHKQGVRLYLNTGGQNPTIHTTPDWNYTIAQGQKKHLIAVADIGSRNDQEGGGSRNDGWNDIVVIDRGDGIAQFVPWVRVFANQRGLGQYPLFTPTPQQTFTPSGGEEGGDEDPPCDDDVLEIGLADVQTTGGSSLVFTKICSNDLHVFWHAGNPAPAPPKNVQVNAIPPNQYGYSYPRVSWNTNTERDLISYQLWRKITGVCGNGTWTVIANDISSATTEYIDESIGTVMQGGDCIAYYKLTARDLAQNTSTYSAEVQIAFSSMIWKAVAGSIRNVPSTYQLHQAFPNPFNPSTQIKFDLPEAGFVSLAVYDVLGRRIVDLVNENREAGYYTATWNAANVSSGVYIARLTVSNEIGKAQFTKLTRLVLMK
jgi:hypothetical protein